MSETKLTDSGAGPLAGRWFLPLVALLLLAMGALQFHTASLEAQTFDEAVHLTAGYSYWKTGDFRLNQEHPPFAKLLAALPLLTMGLRFDTASKNWTLPDQSEMGREFLYTNTRPADDILTAARSVTIGFSLLLGLALALWVRSRFGELAGVAALVLYALDPNFIAHGRYVTTDVAETCLSFLSVIAWLAWLEHGRKRDLIFAALALGLSMATKFSAPYVLPVHFGLALVQVLRGRMRWHTAAASLTAVVAAACAICLLCYGSATFKVDKLADHRYFSGLHELVQHNDDGHPSFLLGNVNRKGDPAYFPVAFAVKSTEVTLLGLLLALALLPRLWRRHGPLVCLALLAYPAFYFALSMKGQINIGVRHLLPIYPFLFALIAAAVAALPKPAAIASTAALAIGLLATNSTIYPDYLAYFNQFAGGPAGGTRYLLDSNVDWGQDVKKLKRYMDEHDIPLVQSPISEWQIWSTTESATAASPAPTSPATSTRSTTGSPSASPTSTTSTSTNPPSPGSSASRPPPRSVGPFTSTISARRPSPPA
ncbi:MAG: glycosyltransferase family 39 protein, partial [Acidobacteriota bacterium]